MNRRVQIILLLVLIFTAGLLTGWFMRPVSLNMIEDASRRDRWQSGNPQERVVAFMAEFQEEITLSPEQAEDVRPLIEAFMKQTNRYKREQLRLRKKAHDETVAAIREILTPEQQDVLDALNATSNRRFQRAVQGPAE